MHAEDVSHMEINRKYSSVDRTRNPTLSLSLSLSVTLQRKMATPEQKAFCVLQFAKQDSVVSFQRPSRRQLQSDPPSADSFRLWYQQFQSTGCLSKGKSAGLPRVTEESVERGRQSFLRSPKKSVLRASREFEMSTAKETGIEALSTSLGAVSLVMLVHRVK